MNIIFDIQGGLGKNIMATAVLKALKKQNPDAAIIVTTSYPDVFANNPNVSKVLMHGSNSGLYRDYVLNQDAKVFITDPYTCSAYLTESESLFETWCKLCEVPYDGEMPEIFISKAEMEYFAPFYKLEKPIMVIQPNGGPENQALKYNWVRDIPEKTMRKIIDHYKKEYTIVHVKREDQPTFANTIAALDGFRSIAVLLMLSKKRLLIDSSVMHIAAALGLPSTVCWIGTSPKVFGYEGHENILANEPNKPIHLDHFYLQKFPLFDDISKCPYEELSDIFDTELIIKSLA
jgi:ADP-heptose:LPS heptosyltransferase